LIITPTESVRAEVRKHFHLPADKVIAIGEAPRRIFQPSTLDEVRSVTERFGIRGDFLLAVGTIEPRKNLKTLVRAFSELHRTLASPPQLVIVGKDGWLTGSFYSQIKESEAAGSIKMTGYVTDSELRALYSSCRAFVYPSVYEGFGLPPLEAMACGAPVIASRIPSLTEVLSDAALFFEACDVRQLKEALAAFLGQDPLREKFREAGRKRSSLFKWEKAADETATVYREAIERFGVAKTASRSSQRNLWHGKT
jgi:glycosyltransferase involved in cell wall biosynthesis